MTRFLSVKIRVIRVIRVLFFLCLLMFLTSCCHLFRFSQITFLRSQPAILSRDDIVMMIQDERFNHPADLSAGGLSGRVAGKFQHKYVAKILDGNGVVIDYATDLMWQQAGSAEGMTWQQAKAYVQQLHQGKFAGYSGWRLPTVEELASLLEFTRQPGTLYIAPVFDPTQRICWSADIFDSPANVWFVYFGHGYISNTDANSELYVRAVRPR